MEWNEMIELLLNSIQIIGVFIAIILGLVISKVMELKKENYEFYKEDNVYSVINSIFEKEEFEMSNSIPYISEREQKDYYNHVKEYISQVLKVIKSGASLEECKRILKVEKYSVEDTIVD